MIYKKELLHLQLAVIDHSSTAAAFSQVTEFGLRGNVCYLCHNPQHCHQDKY